MRGLELWGLPTGESPGFPIGVPVPGFFPALTIHSFSTIKFVTIPGVHPRQILFSGQAGASGHAQSIPRGVVAHRHDVDEDA